MTDTMSFAEMDKNLSRITSLREDCIRAKATAEANLKSKKSRLKELLGEFEALGMNPDNAEEEIKKNSEVLSVKLRVLTEEMESAHKVLVGDNEAL